MARFFLLLLSCFFASIAHGQFDFSTPGGALGGGTKSRAEMVAEVRTIAPGATFTVALKLSHPENWHSYYRNSGGVELSPAIEWTLPPGFKAGPIQWPAPQVKDGFLGKSFIYPGSPVFLTEITAPRDLEAGPLVIKARATWQICDKACINEKAAFEVPLLAATATEPNPEHAALFTAARAALPLQPDGLTIAAKPEGTDIIFTIGPASSVAGEPTDFVPDQPFVQAASAGGSIQRMGDAWVVRLKTRGKNDLDEAIPRGDSFSGILLGNNPVVIPETMIGPAARQPMPAAGFARILGGMFLGGLLLNLMPCVFPVIGLKIMGFVQQAGTDRRKIVVHGVAFTAGVLVSFAVLAGILFAVRASAFGGRGDTLNWGYQLQIPWVVLSLMLLMFVLALNMAGVFEIGAKATSVGGSLQTKHGTGGSFFSGMLATIVATPCSAPFLGAAIGAAIALPVVPFFTAFAAMAFGLATPYLVLSLFPKLVGFLPRPGAWMESFKQAMSFLLFATAGYLLWVYAGQIGLENLLGPVFGLTAVAVAAWIYGRWSLPHRKFSVRVAAVVTAVAFVAAGVWLCKPPEKSALVWEPWSEQRAMEILAAGKPVYIDFTAQWCATCQVNKKRAYTPEVIALMKEKGVVALRADKTNPNPEIDGAIEKLGRTAIPVNVLQQPGKAPVILPELLSPEDVKEALQTLPSAPVPNGDQ
ncbi:MAG: thioredoxin family protein [Verrucomicrobiota bacterium]